MNISLNWSDRSIIALQLPIQTLLLFLTFDFEGKKVSRIFWYHVSFKQMKTIFQNIAKILKIKIL